MIITEELAIRNLRQTCAPMFATLMAAAGVSREEAESLFDDLVDAAKAASRQKRLGGVDANRLLAEAETNPRLRAELEWKGQEGVREEDLRSWWDTPDIERQFWIIKDQSDFKGYYVTLRKNGYTQEQAIREARQAIPIYVEFRESGDRPGEEKADSPLPIELRDRVNRRIERQAGGFSDAVTMLNRMQNPPTQDPRAVEWKKCLSQFSSFNAFVRHEIAAGHL